MGEAHRFEEVPCSRSLRSLGDLAASLGMTEKRVGKIWRAELPQPSCRSHIHNRLRHIMKRSKPLALSLRAPEEARIIFPREPLTSAAARHLTQHPHRPSPKLSFHHPCSPGASNNPHLINLPDTG